MKRKKREYKRMDKLVIAVTCHQGIGSSIWLKLMVSKFMEHHKIPAQVVQSDIQGVGFTDVDLVIGMEYLEEQIKRTGKPYIVIDNILDEELHEKLSKVPMIETKMS